MWDNTSLQNTYETKLESEYWHLTFDVGSKLKKLDMLGRWQVEHVITERNWLAEVDSW